MVAVKILLFKSNIGVQKERPRISEFLDNEKKITKWELLGEDEITVLSVLCSGLTMRNFKDKIKPFGFECELWHE